MSHAEVCPVCKGTGQVSQGFYNGTVGQWTTSPNATEPCRSCNGTGIVVVKDDYAPIAHGLQPDGYNLPVEFVWLTTEYS